MLIKATRPPFVQRARLGYILCAAIVTLLPDRALADVLRDCEQIENAPLAIRACSRLISDIPGSAALHNRRGIAYMRNGEVDRAIADYTEALRLDPRATDTYYSRGRALLDKNAYTEAILDFGQAIARNPKHPLARNGRAWALFRLGNLAAALEEADQAIAADAKYAAAYDTRAHIYEALGKRDQAIADFRQAIVLDPHNPLVHITREGLRRLGAAPLTRRSLAVRKVVPLDVVETIREGLLVLEPNLTIGFANRSFCQTFGVSPEDIIGRKLYELGNGQWDIPQLRTALETIISGPETIEAFEVDQVFPSIGRRVMVLNARKVYRPGNKIQQILLAIEDVTERVRLEREHAAAHERIGMLMQELTHRVKNSLQSMVMIEARSHKSGEGKAALERVSHRIDALGQLYAKLSKSDTVEAVDAATYLDDLCRDLVASVQGGTSIVLKTDIESELIPTDRAIPMGLIVNELVTNALKYAFPSETKGTVIVTLKRIPGALRLTVADDGKGIDIRRADSGLGGRLVEGFAQQLGGQVERESSSQGTTVRLILPSHDDRAKSN